MTQSFCEALASPAAGQGFQWQLLVRLQFPSRFQPLSSAYPSTTNACGLHSQVPVLPPLAFVAFLALRFRRTLRKLQYSALEIMFFYFALWVVATLLLLRAVALVQPLLEF